MRNVLELLEWSSWVWRGNRMSEALLIPKEKVSEEELFEIQKLKEESVKGEHVEWEELKREHSL